MIIFIDTNIFFNNWYLENANFKYLFNYLENTNSKLAISEIVCEEVDGKFKSEFSKIKNQYEDSFKRLNTFLQEKTFSTPNTFNIDYSFKKEVINSTDNTLFVNYNNISNEVLVNRAINRTRPFKDEDKGFRDTLIWLSFIQFLDQETVDDRIAFISNNPTDFYDNSKTGLHPDLLDDIKKMGLENEFNIYHSIKEFIDKEVDKEHNKYSPNQILEDFIYESENQIEDEISHFINFLPASESQSFLRNSEGELSTIPHITGFDFVIIEGTEDPELLNWAITNDSDLYIELYLNLRRVEFRFSIPITVYTNRKKYFDNSFFNIEEDEDVVTLSIIKRPHLNISFNFKVDEKLVANTVINSLEVK